MGAHAVDVQLWQCSIWDVEVSFNQILQKEGQIPCKCPGIGWFPFSCIDFSLSEEPCP